MLGFLPNREGSGATKAARWAGIAVICSVLVVGWWAFVTSSDGGIALVLLLAGTAAALLTFVALMTGHEILSGLGMIVTGLAVPTYFAYPVSLASLLLGICFLVGGSPRRRPNARRA